MCSRSWCRDRNEMEGLGGRNSWGSIVGLPLCLSGTWSESLASWEVTRASERGQFLPAIAAPNKGKKKDMLKESCPQFSRAWQDKSYPHIPSSSLNHDS